MPDAEKGTVFITLPEAQTLYNLRDAVTDVTINLAQVGHEAAVSEATAALTLAEANLANTTLGGAFADTVTVLIPPPDAQIVGRVLRIAPQATTIAGDVVYTVVVTLDAQPPTLRWGMSAEIETRSE